MTFATRFYDYQHLSPPAHGGKCSPNLLSLQQTMAEKYPSLFVGLGCWGVRAIRGGIAPSTHTFGAAIDFGYRASADPVQVADIAIPFMIAWSKELGIQAIHDYRRCRIWRAGRTHHLEDACSLWWRAQRRSGITGMGQVWANHLHVETPPEEWSNALGWRDRGIL